jgi:hypothetical protein
VKSQLHPTRGGIMLCAWHLGGVPSHAFGRRFFVAGCARCEEKAAADPTLRQAPEIWQISQKNASFRAANRAAIAEGRAKQAARCA